MWVRCFIYGVGISLLDHDLFAVYNVKTSREIMDILHELHEQGNTVVLITHDNDIARQAKRSLHILDGQVTEVQL